ncbi:hypothetical protein BFJ66_g15798 [Fusarium oxysporum f. sp. cepae]|nr:hypothetical protein BFJ66_g15798 [Fusarium oxysporum f. sp. cepae]
MVLESHGEVEDFYDHFTRHLRFIAFKTIDLRDTQTVVKLNQFASTDDVGHHPSPLSDDQNKSKQVKSLIGIESPSPYLPNDTLADRFRGKVDWVLMRALDTTTTANISVNSTPNNNPHKMSNPEVSKQQALRALETTIFVLGLAIESCCIAEGNPDIPKAFSIVAKHLPVAEQVFSLARTYLKQSKEETEQVRELYPVVKHVADESCEQLRSIENLFDTVTQDGEKAERYVSGVKSGDGKKVETIMVELLTNASLMAVEPLVNQDNVKTLQGALEEVKKLPPSLKEDRSVGVVLNNSGSGNQFYHGGRGNLNHCFGGFQVSGDNRNARYTYAENPKSDEY